MVENIYICILYIHVFLYFPSLFVPPSTICTFYLRLSLSVFLSFCLFISFTGPTNHIHFVFLCVVFLFVRLFFGLCFLPPSRSRAQSKSIIFYFFIFSFSPPLHLSSFHVSSGSLFCFSFTISLPSQPSLIKGYFLFSPSLDMDKHLHRRTHTEELNGVRTWGLPSYIPGRMPQGHSGSWRINF